MKQAAKMMAVAAVAVEANIFQDIGTFIKDLPETRSDAISRYIGD